MIVSNASGSISVKLLKRSCITIGCTSTKIHEEKSPVIVGMTEAEGGRQYYFVLIRVFLPVFLEFFIYCSLDTYAYIYIYAYKRL